jgi:hypothetical protein
MTIAEAATLRACSCSKRRAQDLHLAKMMQIVLRDGADVTAGTHPK